MKYIRNPIMVGIAIAVLGTALGHAEPQPLPKGVQDVIQLTQAGIGQDIILRQIKSTRSHYDLSVDQIIALKNLGVKEVVISALLSAPEPAPITTEARIPEPGAPAGGGVAEVTSQVTPGPSLD